MNAPRNHRIWGFTLIEMLVVIAIIGILASMLLPALSRARIKGNMAKCMSNLSQIGKSMHVYLSDMEDKLPLAGIRMTGRNPDVSWDDLMSGYLGLQYNPVQANSNLPDPGYVLKVLHCPSDKQPLINYAQPSGGSPGGWKRSYAITENNMGAFTIGGRAPIAADWPPSSTSQTGIGLWWDNYQGGANTASAQWPPTAPIAGPVPSGLPNIRLQVARDQVGTIAFTDCIWDDNIGGRNDTFYIASANNHIGGANAPLSANFHLNLYNYLFLDGHVDTLDPRATLGKTSTALSVQTGMWTITPTD